MNKYLKFTIASIVIIGLFSASNSVSAREDSAGPDAFSSEEPVSVAGFSSRLEIAPGEEFRVALKISIDDQWHVNSNSPTQDFLIPTAVTLDDNSGYKIVKFRYPQGDRKAFEFNPDEPLSVYGGSIWIDLLLASDSLAESGDLPLSVNLTTQACNDRYCLAPVTQILEFPIKIDPAFAGHEIRHPSVFEDAFFKDSKPPIPAAGADSKSSEGFWGMIRNFDAAEFVGRFGYFLAFIAMYILGLGLTLTPCVYPIIPITIGYFGSQAGGHWGRQFLIAVVYGVGISISYATIGTVAAFSGALMGAALQSVWVLLALAILLIAMGFNAFGVYEIRLPTWLMGLAGGSGRKGVIGAAVMGLTMGIASAPCLAAFIISLLAFVGQKGDPVLGFSMFFVLGLGLATPFVLLGTFSGMVNNIPKSGAWMVYAKKLMGSLLFGAALYFLHTVIPVRIFHSIVMVCLTAAGLYFGYFENSLATSPVFKSMKISVGVIFIAVALWWGMPAEQGLPTDGVNWQPYSETALKQAIDSGRPVVIDFYADWCIPCKELDKYSFSDENVIGLSREFLMLKSDLTRGNDPGVKDLVEKFGIKGVPTILFIDKHGLELADIRVVQFEKADEISRRLQKAVSE